MSCSLAEIAPFVRKCFPTIGSLKDGALNPVLKERYLHDLMEPIFQAHRIIAEILEVSLNSLKLNKTSTKFSLTFTKQELSDRNILKAVAAFFDTYSPDLVFQTYPSENKDSIPDDFIWRGTSAFWDEEFDCAIAVTCGIDAMKVLIPHLSKQQQGILDAKLFKAVYQDKPEEVSTLTQLGANVNSLGPFGRTPLFFVQTPKMIDTLVSFQANVNVVDESQRTPLDVAILFGVLNNNIFVDVLPKHGALTSHQVEQLKKNRRAHMGTLSETLAHYRRMQSKTKTSKES